MITIIFTFSMVTFFLIQCYNWGLLYHKVKNIPSPPSTFLFGHAFLLSGTSEYLYDTMFKLREKYKSIMAIWLGPLLNIIIINPRYLEAILGDKKKTEKGALYDFLKPLFGDNILSLNGPEFDQNKKIILQTFCTKNVILSIDIFNRNCEEVMNLMSKELDQGVFNVGRYLGRYTMYNLLEATLNIDKSFLTEEEIHDFSCSVEKIAGFACERSLKLWLYFDIMFKFSSLKRKQDKEIKTAHNVIRKCIQQRRLVYENNLKNSEEVTSKNKTSIFLDGFFSYVKPNGDQFTYKEIRNEALIVMIGGHESTLVRLGFTLLILGQHQDIQEKARAEVREILGDSLRPLSYEDTQKMQYLEQILCEIGRLYPSANYMSRTLLEDVQIDNYTIPKKTQLFIPIKFINLNPETFPDPEKFNPDNFLPEVVKQRHPYSYIPFSIGYRKCIGMKFASLSSKIFLANFLRKFKVTSDEFELQKNFSLSSFPKNGFQISITQI